MEKGAEERQDWFVAKKRRRTSPVSAAKGREKDKGEVVGHPEESRTRRKGHDQALAVAKKVDIAGKSSGLVKVRQNDGVGERYRRGVAYS